MIEQVAISLSRPVINYTIIYDVECVCVHMLMYGVDMFLCVNLYCIASH